MFTENVLPKSILVVAAHPDDEVLGIGGTIAKFANDGADLYICILAEGATSRYEDKMIAQLKESALKASRILGAKEVYFEDLPDERLDQIPFIDVIKPIERRIVEIKPDIVFTHHRGDANTDHQIAFKATIAATRTLRGNAIKKILCYEVPSSTEQSPPFLEYTFNPNVFVDITDTLDKKMMAMRAYQSEVGEYPHPRSIEALTITAKHWGVKVGLGAAEAFVLVREIIT
jgi:LmbE family N-acetylglucosaminyl deacetylase